MRGVRARAALAVGVVLVALTTACTVDQPGPEAWRDLARQSLEDVASEVATAELTLIQLAEDRLPVSYGVTVLVGAEQALSTAEDGLASVQPPEGLDRRADELLVLIGRAGDAVRQARESVVAGRLELPRLVDLLRRLQDTFDRRRAAL